MSDVAVLDELVEEALEASGFPWKRREPAWVVPPGAAVAREVRVTAEGAAVRIEAVLALWDEIGEAEGLALARLLSRAGRSLRFARCELSEGEARVVAGVAAEDVEAKLGDALGAVAAGTHLLAHEVEALLTPEVARAFLGFLEGAGEKAVPVLT
jgi:hypothetical protein